MAVRAVVFALALSGCSFVLTRDAKPPSTSCGPRAAPIADTAAAVVAAMGALYFATSDDATTALIVDTTLVIGFAAGAYVGYGRVDQCR